MASHKNHQDPEFKHLREVVKWLHDYECYICKKKLNELDVHHLDKISTNHSLLNLVPACKPCHIYLGKVATLKPLTKSHINSLIWRKASLWKE